MIWFTIFYFARFLKGTAFTVSETKTEILCGIEELSPQRQIRDYLILIVR